MGALKKKKWAAAQKTEGVDADERDGILFMLKNVMMLIFKVE